jgi:hypothetical protein
MYCLNILMYNVLFMGFKSQTGSRRSAGRRFQKSQHEKAKTKAQKHRAGGNYAQEEIPGPPLGEVVEKTLNKLRNLGSQKFAVSPFSQYFDDWLLNVREVLSEFESSPALEVDEEFVKERSQIFLDIEREFAETRLKETALEETAKNLPDANHLIVQIDAEYAAKSRENGLNRNSEVQRLTRNVHDLEEELDRVSRMKTSLFGSFSKKAKARKEAEVTQKLNSAKSDLELVVQNFTVEQEKLHDEYEKRKQAAIEQVQRIEKEIETLETDGSLEARRVACDALVNGVNALLQRKQSLAV